MSEIDPEIIEEGVLMKSLSFTIISLILFLNMVAFGSHPFNTDPGTLIDGFENVSDWNISGIGATAENCISIAKFYGQSIKLNATGGNTATLIKTVNLDLSRGAIFSIWYYVMDKSNINNIALFISSTKNLNRYFRLYLGDAIDGWNFRTFLKSDFANIGDECWDNIMIEITVKVYPKSNTNASVCFNDLRFGMIGLPKVILTFDGPHEGTFTKAYPIMSANCQAGTLFVQSSTVGINGYMNLDNLKTLQAAGWDISNHTTHHLNLIAVSQEDMESDVDTCYDWLLANGFGDTAKFFAYPGGYWNEVVVDKVKQRHVLARTATTYATHCSHFDIIDSDDLQYKLGGYGVNATTNIDNVKEKIDLTILKGDVCVFTFHNTVDTDPIINDHLTENFKIISDYLKAMQDAGLLEVITFSDYYNALIRWHRLEPEPSCPEMDFNGDCIFDIKDYEIFMQKWLELYPEL